MNVREQDEKFEVKVYKVKKNLVHRGRFFLDGEHIALNELDAMHFEEDEIELYQFRYKKDS